MVEGYVADAGPAVLDDGVRCKLGHSVHGVSVYAKLLKTSANSHLFTPAFLVILKVHRSLPRSMVFTIRTWNWLFGSSWERI